MTTAKSPKPILPLAVMRAVTDQILKAREDYKRDLEALNLAVKRVGALAKKELAEEVRISKGEMSRLRDELKKVRQELLSRITSQLEQIVKAAAYKSGFADGRKEVVQTLGSKILEQYGCATYAELYAAGQEPAWWIAALVEMLTDTAQAAKVIEKERSEGWLAQPMHPAISDTDSETPCRADS